MNYTRLINKYICLYLYHVRFSFQFFFTYSTSLLICCFYCFCFYLSNAISIQCASSCRAINIYHCNRKATSELFAIILIRCFFFLFFLRNKLKNYSLTLNISRLGFLKLGSNSKLCQLGIDTSRSCSVMKTSHLWLAFCVSTLPQPYKRTMAKKIRVTWLLRMSNIWKQPVR